MKIDNLIQILVRITAAIVLVILLAKLSLRMSAL